MNLLRSAKKGQLTNYCLFIASRWFETIEDYIYVEIGCKRFNGNLTKFFYNPIPLNEITREFFPYLQTLFIYSSKDMKFENDKRIQRREYVKVKKYDLFIEQIKQIEEWTELKCDEIVFDSTKDDWKENTSTFDKSIIGRKQLLFLIEDTRGQIFGYYLNTEVTNSRNPHSSTDSKSFEFNLESNGRLSKPMKFEIIDTSRGCWLCENSSWWLIVLGEIVLQKENRKSWSHCDQYDYRFNYHGIQKAVCGTILYDNAYFNPKRFLVIQMK